MIMTMMTKSYLLLGSEVAVAVAADLHHTTILITITIIDI
jgi:hypothetical protein